MKGKSSRNRLMGILAVGILLLLGVWKLVQTVNLNPFHTVGEEIDSLDGVTVYFNGGVNNVEERNVAGTYNLGLKYQCVEFVKRYYYQHYGHKMPDAYGHAKSFFDPAIADGKYNAQRDLFQYANPSAKRPEKGDLLVFGASWFNPYGHVAIISEVQENSIEIIQQNAGPFSSSRENFELILDKEGKWEIFERRVLGWLRKEER